MSSLSLTELRQRHPLFSYDSYQAEVTAAGLEVTFFFKLKPDILFKPQLVIHGVKKADWAAIPQSLRNAWLFQLGLAEIPSYWKATASPEIVIRAGFLDQTQIDWWQKLLIKGLGEYFYQNQIDFTEDDFVYWHVDHEAVEKTASKAATAAQTIQHTKKTKRYLLPLGGGKDSAAAASFLKEQGQPFATLLLNPTPAMKQVNQVLEPIETIEISRQIDPKLLELNQVGYLNGHVPFSAYLAFLSRWTAHLFGYQSVVIANERSSNQGNVQYLGQEINHQYSKSYEFESDFNQYLQQNNLAVETELPNYFSLLRPLYELQISRLLSRSPLFPQLASVFRSCNQGQKTNEWCGACPKCLFTFISFLPFIGLERTEKIFGQNLLNKNSLLPIAQDLVGLGQTKPFECVGTYTESQVAFYLCREHYLNKKLALPPLLTQIWSKLAAAQDLTSKKLTEEMKTTAEKLLSAWNDSHQLPAELELGLKDAGTT